MTNKTANKYTEYSVYTVCKANQSNDNQPAWERKHTTGNYRKAIARAKVLHRSAEYARVEVKKIACDARNVCTVKEGYKIYDHLNEHHYRRRVIGVALCFGAVLLAGLAFSIV